MPSLLTGLVYDETGDLLCPTHANKKGTRYRYYISKRLMHPSDPGSGGWRLPAKELEGVVLRGIVGLLKDDLRLWEALQMKDTSADRSHEVMKQAAALAGDLLQGSPVTCEQVTEGCFEVITLSSHLGQRLGRDVLRTIVVVHWIAARLIAGAAASCDAAAP